MNKLIVFVEDDHFDRELIGEFLKRKFPNFLVRFFSTEAEFHAAFSEIVAVPPVLAMLDVRVRWTDPAPVRPELPAEVLSGTYREAGFRCWKMLRQNGGTAKVPVVFYTGIDEQRNAGQDILADPLVRFAEKAEKDDEVLQAIRQLLRAA